MMEEVHKAISRHSQSQHDEVQAFIRLDGEREQKIEEAILKCREREPFSVAEINDITGKMNSLAGKVNLPMRKTVTEDMVREFVEKKSRG